MYRHLVLGALVLSLIVFAPITALSQPISKNQGTQTDVSIPFSLPIMATITVVIVAVAVVAGGSVQASHHSSQTLGAYIITNTPTKTMAAPT